MGKESTRSISESFVESISEGDPSKCLNSFGSSINSLASVLAANISNSLDGEKIFIDEFINADKYAEYRKNPSRG